MKTSLHRTLFLFVILFALAARAQIPFARGQPAPKLDALFQRTNGWIGGDGAYSVLLFPPGQTVWLFSDTWIGQVSDGHRTNQTMVNNTLAIQDGLDPHAKVQFIVRHDADGKPIAFLTPEDKRGWFWFHSGAFIDGRLFLFLTQMESTGAGGAFGFRQIGESLVVVTNPLAPPLEWHIQQQKLPCFEFGPERHQTFGAACLVASDDYLYIYGTDENIRPAKLERFLTVARVPLNCVSDVSAWRYFTGEIWEADFHHATHLADRMATECSVSFLPKLGQYILVYTDGGLSPKIQVRTSRIPWGKWSAASTVYECPEMAKDKKLFCYAAKAHPGLLPDDALTISYVVNSRDVAQVITDASLYWPRFVRIPLAPVSR
jgi:hypothetical protein